MPANMPLPIPPPVIGSIILAASPTRAMPLPTDFLIGGDDALRLDVHLLLEAFGANAANPSVVLDDRRRGGLEPDIRARLRGLLRHSLVECVPLEHDPDLVARVGFFDRQLGAVWRKDLRAFDFAADPLAVEGHLRVLDEVPSEALATADRRTDLLPFLDQQGTAAAGRRIPRGHGAGRTCTDHDDIVLVGGHSRDHSSSRDISD